MLCQNCGKNEANIRYTQIINGIKKEIALCTECASKLGLERVDFPLDFNNFLGDLFSDLASSPEEGLLSGVSKADYKCKKCGMTFNEFINTGRFGCEECYETFKAPLDSFLKNIHGTSRHIGRGPNGIAPKLEVSNLTKTKEKEELKEVKPVDKKAKLEQDLQKAIADERYEDAAKIRDELKEMSE